MLAADADVVTADGLEFALIKLNLLRDAAIAGLAGAVLVDAFGGAKLGVWGGRNRGGGVPLPPWGQDQHARRGWIEGGEDCRTTAATAAAALPPSCCRRRHHRAKPPLQRCHSRRRHRQLHHRAATVTLSRCCHRSHCPTAAAAALLLRCCRRHHHSTKPPPQHLRHQAVALQRHSQAALPPSCRRSRHRCHAVKLMSPPSLCRAAATASGSLALHRHAATATTPPPSCCCRAAATTTIQPTQSCHCSRHWPLPQTLPAAAAVTLLRCRHRRHHHRATAASCCCHRYHHAKLPPQCCHHQRHQWHHLAVAIML
jgi:hypothetical protein